MPNINFKKLMIVGMTASLLAGCEAIDQNQENSESKTGNVNKEGDVAVSEVKESTFSAKISK